MADRKEVRSFQIQARSGLFSKGKTWQVSFKCPHCNDKLVSQENEVGIPDFCPQCSGEFIIHSEAAKAIGRARAKEEEAERKRELDAIRAAQELADLKQAENEEREKLKRQRAEEVKREMLLRKEQTRLEEQKETYRNRQIREYPALQGLVSIIDACRWLVVVGAALVIISSVIITATLPDDEHKAVTLIGVIFFTIAWAASTVFMLSLCRECISLAVNVAQDVERIVNNGEALLKKPWAQHDDT